MHWHLDCTADRFEEHVLEYATKKRATINYDTRTDDIKGVGEVLERYNACLRTCAADLKVFCAAVLDRLVIYRSALASDTEG